MPAFTAQESEPSLRRVGTYTRRVSDHLSLRLYESTKPHDSKIAALQKGLILVVNGQEAVREGTGFGSPVLAYSDETYFSGSSSLYVAARSRRRAILKVFNMDRVARNSFRNVTLENHAASSFIERLGHLYRAHPRMRFLTLKELTGSVNVGKVFPEAASVGKVSVTYTVEESRVTVKADFSDVCMKGLRKVFVLNEQGSTLFRSYSDSSGTELTDGQIGAWDVVEAEWACLSTLRCDAGFRLRRVEGSILRRGRECLSGSLDWAGLDYEVSLGTDVFEYVIELLGGGRP